MAFGVMDADDRLKMWRQKLRGLNKDRQALRVASVHFFKSLDKGLIHSVIFVDKIEHDGELGVGLPDLSWLSSVVVFVHHYF
jgi:hypothetical protein